MKEFESRVGQKGQITLPAEIRHRLGIKARDTVQLVQEGDAITVKPRKSILLEGFGVVAPSARPEDWAKIREETERQMAEDARTRGQH